jgi:hypothetical protein
LLDLLIFQKGKKKSEVFFYDQVFGKTYYKYIQLHIKPAIYQFLTKQFWRARKTVVGSKRWPIRTLQTKWQKLIGRIARSEFS